MLGIPENLDDQKRLSDAAIAKASKLNLILVFETTFVAVTMLFIVLFSTTLEYSTVSRQASIPVISLFAFPVLLALLWRNSRGEQGAVTTRQRKFLLPAVLGYLFLVLACGQAYLAYLHIEAAAGWVASAGSERAGRAGQEVFRHMAGCPTARLNDGI